MSNDKLFDPYKIISQTGNSLHLQAGRGVKIIRVVFLLAPLILLGAGIALYLTQKEIFFLYVLGGAAALEFILFSFIQLPGDVQMDNMGFTLQLVSLQGKKQKDYLWTDVDAMHRRIMRTKNGAVLNYQVVLKSGKKQRFLSFPNYHGKKQSIPEINDVLQHISGKNVVEK